jgi:hypothetical protein
MRRIQFRLWHLMSTLVIVALIIAGILWLFSPVPPPDSPYVFRSNFWVTLSVAGYAIPHTSPVFWVVTCILLAAVLGIVAGLIVTLMWAARALCRVGPRSRSA